MNERGKWSVVSIGPTTRKPAVTVTERLAK